MQRENRNKKVIPNRGLYRLVAPRKVFIRGLITMIWNLQRKVVSQRQQRQAWKTLNQVQGDDLVCYNYNNAFTLIELLVVVLIIGILASVALPQYQKAVDKARLVQLIVLNKAIREAEERYYLANGSYTNDFNVLDVGFAATEESGHYWKLADGTSFYLASGGLDQSIYTYSPLLPGVSLRSVYNRAGYGDMRDGRMLCYADKNNARANRACKSIGTGCHLVDEGRNLCFVSQQ